LLCVSTVFQKTVPRAIEEASTESVDNAIDIDTVRVSKLLPLDSATGFILGCHVKDGVLYDGQMLLFYNDESDITSTYNNEPVPGLFELRQSSSRALKPTWMHVSKRPACIREIKDQAFAFQTRTEFNPHHTLNDNIFMMWRVILDSGTANAKKILFSNFPFVTEGPPVQSWQLLPLLFETIESIDELLLFSSHSPVCFDSLYWGGANIPKTDAFVYTSLPSEKGSKMYPDNFLKRFKEQIHSFMGIKDISDEKEADTRTRRRAILLPRPPSKDGRFFHPDSVQRIVDAFRSVNVETDILDIKTVDKTKDVFDPLRYSISMNTTLHMLHAADIIISIWGSSLANSAFMREGTVLVDLLVSETYHGYHGPAVCCIFPGHAFLNKMVYISGNVLRFQTRDSGVDVPSDWAERMAEYVVNHPTEIQTKHVILYLLVYICIKSY
jgi:hypothetical protein